MGLSRQRFTREFIITAVRWLQQGESVAVLARALEVNPSVRSSKVTCVFEFPNVD